MNSEDSLRHLHWGDQLRTILRSKKPSIVVGQGSRIAWAKEMKTLQNKLGKDKSSSSRIQEMLDWYKENINEIDKPTIANAEQFRRCFNWLEDIRREIEQDTRVNRIAW